MQNPKAVVIIPAFNEEKTIAKVLADLKAIKQQHPELVSHIIVVNDGSTDRTREIAESLADEVIHFRKNRGKAHAFFAGLRRCRQRKAEVMVTLDADLEEVTVKQIRSLTLPLGKPVKRFNAMMSIGTTTRAPITLSGQRAFLVKGFNAIFIRKSLKRMLLGIKNNRTGYGLERFLNWFFTGSYEPWAFSYSQSSRAVVTDLVHAKFRAEPFDSLGRAHMENVLSEVDRMSEILGKRHERFSQAKAERERRRTARQERKKPK